VIAEHDIGGLQIAMDDPPLVGVGHGFTDLEEHVHQAPEGPTRRGDVPPDPVYLRDHRSERLAVDLFHCIVEATVREAAEFVNRHYARMLKLRCCLCLFDEADKCGGACHQRGPDDLHGDGSVQVTVANPPNLAHRTATDLAQIDVARDQFRIHRRPRWTLLLSLCLWQKSLHG